MGPRLFAVLLAHDGVGLFRLPHRDVRLLAALPRDRQEDEFLRNVQEAESLFDVDRVDVGLRPADVFRRDLLCPLLVGEHAGLSRSSIAYRASPNSDAMSAIKLIR